jgi:hypothetical protein
MGRDWFERMNHSSFIRENPYVCDSLRSPSHRVELDGVVRQRRRRNLAVQNRSADALYRPHRCRLLTWSQAKTEPYVPLGITSAYWTFKRRAVSDIAWAYDYPLREVRDHQYLTTGMPPSRGGDPEYPYGHGGGVQSSVSGWAGAPRPMGTTTVGLPR